MLPYADQLFKDADFIFQQDLLVLGVLDWPSNSLDLNPYRESMGYCQEENKKQETKKWR